MMIDGSDDHKLARDIIDVHGTEAATVARGNARGAALAGQAAQAKSWIRVLGVIQRQQAGKPSAGDLPPATAHNEIKTASCKSNKSYMDGYLKNKMATVL